MNKEQRKFRKVIKARRLRERWKARMKAFEGVVKQFGGLGKVPDAILKKYDYQSKKFNQWYQTPKKKSPSVSRRKKSA